MKFHFLNCLMIDDSWNAGVAVYIPWIKYIYIKYIFIYHYIYVYIYTCANMCYIYVCVVCIYIYIYMHTWGLCWGCIRWCVRVGVCVCMRWVSSDKFLENFYSFDNFCWSCDTPLLLAQTSRFESKIHPNMIYNLLPQHSVK